MILWIVQITLISMISIFLVHHLITFFKNTLTIPKIKDLVNAPIQRYEDMYEIIQSSKKEQINTDNVDEKPTYSLDNLLPNPTHDTKRDNIITDETMRTDDNTTSINRLNSVNTMKDELKIFLKKQMNASGVDTKNTSDFASTTNNFSFY